MPNGKPEHLTLRARFWANWPVVYTGLEHLKPGQTAFHWRIELPPPEPVRPYIHHKKLQAIARAKARAALAEKLEPRKNALRVKAVA